jgi:hypothetical protein
MSFSIFLAFDFRPASGPTSQSSFFCHAEDEMLQVAYDDGPSLLATNHKYYKFIYVTIYQEGMRLYFVVPRNSHHSYMYIG